MIIPELLSKIRLRLNDYKTPSKELLTYAQTAETRLFLKLQQSGDESIQSELKRALQEEVTDVVSKSRQKVVLSSDPITDPEVYLAGEKCHIISLAGSQQVEQSVGFKPAAVINGRNVTFKPKYGWGVTSQAVSISYEHSPRPLIYMTGLTVAFDESRRYGVTGKTGFYKLNVLIPSSDELPQFSENELVGAIATTQSNENYIIDYTIEEHPSGAFSYFFVDATKAKRRLNIDFTFETQPEVSGVIGKLATVHRGSDLPQRFHEAIIDEVVAMLSPQPVKQEKK